MLDGIKLFAIINTYQGDKAKKRRYKMNSFKRESIQQVVIMVRDELGCSLLEAVTKMQATAAKQGKEELLSDLCEYKNELIEALF